MRGQKIAPRDQNYSPNYFEAQASVNPAGQSDFPPSFWLATAERKPGTAIERRSMSYPILVGVFVIFAFLMQQTFFSS